MAELLSIKEASQWATEYLDKNVTTSNISYLIQYGRIKKIGDNGCTVYTLFGRSPSGRAFHFNP